MFQIKLCYDVKIFEQFGGTDDSSQCGKKLLGNQRILPL